MTYVMVDIESDGPIPGDYSMICFGAVIVEPSLSRSFYGQLKPISDHFVPAALAVSGFSRQQCLAFDDRHWAFKWGIHGSRVKAEFLAATRAVSRSLARQLVWCLSCSVV
ncbi:hypothetical protein, partial [Romeriopsis navalis]|uniref:hypothetical protein n=1 Tax=Romeriopsis navalis TaxID=2992132 RepID=UPI0021F81DB7